MDLFNYIKTYGNIEILNINNIDALIFARLSYLHLEVIKDKLPLKINELSKFLKEMKNNKYDEKLLLGIMHTRRFQNILLTRFESVLDEQKEEQFAALTIKFKDNASFISYRGTTKSLIAYKEDLNMSYKIVPAQIDALKYLEKEKSTNLYVGGHSKGGNLSMYASINASFWKRLKIKKIYNFDGPGFLTLTKSFDKMKNKIINFCPENDLVGCLLYNNAEKKIIKTSHQGIEAHNVYYWQVMGNDFVLGSQTSDSVAFSYANIRVITKIDDTKKKIIIDYLFNLFEKRNLKSLKELNIDEIKTIINDIPTLLTNEKEELMKMVKLFLKIAFISPIKGEKILHKKN